MLIVHIIKSPKLSFLVYFCCHMKIVVASVTQLVKMLHW